MSGPAAVSHRAVQGRARGLAFACGRVALNLPVFQTLRGRVPVVSDPPMSLPARQCPSAENGQAACSPGHQRPLLSRSIVGRIVFIAAIGHGRGFRPDRTPGVRQRPASAVVARGGAVQGLRRSGDHVAGRRGQTLRDFAHGTGRVKPQRPTTISLTKLAPAQDRPR